MEAFPGSEDYEEGNDPVRDLTLLEQIGYWKARSRAAEEMLHKIEEFDAVLEEIDGDRNDHDSADWWKDASFASE